MFGMNHMLGRDLEGICQGTKTVKNPEGSLAGWGLKLGGFVSIDKRKTHDGAWVWNEGE